MKGLGIPGVDTVKAHVQGKLAERVLEGGEGPGLESCRIAGGPEKQC